MTEDPIRRLMQMGRDLSKVRLPTLPQSLDSVAFICVNAYESFRSGEGKGPLNDAVHFAKMFKSYCYEIYFIVSPNVKNFLEYFDTFLEKATNRLITLYLGHETFKTPENDKNEAFLFSDGIITNSVVIDHITQKKQAHSELIMISDACQPSSIWNINNGIVAGVKIPPRILSISAANADEDFEITAVQARLNASAFTKLVVKALKNNSAVTPQQLLSMAGKELEKYNQTFVVGSSSSELLKVPLFLNEYQ